MKTIRNNVFETNSSSTHSVTTMNSERFEKFLNGEELIVYNYDSLEIIPFKNLTTQMVNDNKIFNLDGLLKNSYSCGSYIRNNFKQEINNPMIIELDDNSDTLEITHLSNDNYTIILDITV